MKGLLSSLLVVVVVTLAVLFYAIPVSTVHALTTTTTTVIGWLVPDGSHFNNGIGALLFPLVGVGLFAGMGKILDVDGDFAVTLMLSGLTLGGVLGMLSINASSSNIIPFALVIIPGLDLLIWIWKGGG